MVPFGLSQRAEAVILLLFLVSLMAASSGSQLYTCSNSIYEHSYLATMDNGYLSFERLNFYQQRGFFTTECPAPRPLELLLAIR